MATSSSLTDAVAAIRGLFDAAACSIALVDGATLRYVAADGAGAAEIVGVQMPISKGIGGWTVMSGQPIAVRDVASDPRFARDVAESTRYVPTAIVTAPLFDAEGDGCGVLTLLDPADDQNSGWTLRVLGTLAALVGTIVAADNQQDDGDRQMAALGRHVAALVGDLDR